MTLRSAMASCLFFTFILLGVMAPTQAWAQRRVAVVKFSGADTAVLRGAVMTSISDNHTILLPNDVDGKAKEVGLTSKCKPANVAALGSALKAEAVVCGSTRGVPWRRRFTLTVYNGANGKKLGSAAVILRRAGFSEAHMERMSPNLNKALALATPMNAPEEPGAKPEAPGALKPVSELSKDLDSPVLGDRLDAVKELARHRNWQAAPALSCALLRDGDINVREQAAQELTRSWHDQVVIQALRTSAFLEPDSGLRNKVRTGLVKMKAEAPALIAGLSDPDQNKRLASVQALAMAGYKEALNPLAKAAGDIDPRVRLFALQGLRVFSEAVARSTIRRATADRDATVAGAARAFVNEYKRLAAWRLFHMSYMKVVRKTNSRLASWRADAAIALGISGADTAVRRLEELLRYDKVASVRLAAAWSLRLLNNPRSIAAVRNSSKSDSDPRVRLSCSQFLGLETINMAQQLVKLNDKLAEFRIMAAQTIALRPAGKTVQHLARSAMCDPNEQVRLAALSGLAREGSARSREVIKLAMFRDGSDDVRRFAMMLHVLVGWEEPEPDKAAASKETASWMSDAEDPLAAERRRMEAQRKAEQEKKKKVEEASPRCPVGDCHGIRVMVGASGLFLRHFAVDAGDDGRSVDEESMTSTPVAGLGFGFELYPGAFFTKGWFSNIGIGLRYARSFGLSWKTDKASDDDDATSITHQVISVDFLRFRLQPVRTEKTPIINFRFGLNHQEFSFNDEDDVGASPVPDLKALSLVLGLNLEIPVKRVKIIIGFDYLPMLSWGELTKATDFRTVSRTSPGDPLGPLKGYGEGSGYALQAMVGLRGPLAWKLGWQFEATYNYYNLTFDKVGARIAEGSQDHFLSGVLYLTFAY